MQATPAECTARRSNQTSSRPSHWHTGSKRALSKMVSRCETATETVGLTFRQKKTRNEPLRCWSISIGSRFVTYRAPRGTALLISSTRNFRHLPARGGQSMIVSVLSVSLSGNIQFSRRQRSRLTASERRARRDCRFQARPMNRLAVPMNLLNELRWHAVRHCENSPP